MRTLAICLFVVAVTVSEAAVAADPPLRPIDPPVRIVALGDSFSSGQGLTPQLAENVPRCRRAANSYPRVVERSLELRVGTTTDDLVSLSDATCSGASLAHTTTPQTTPVGVNQAQFNALSAVGGNGADYVTFGFGANDIALHGLLRACRGASESGRETCAQSMARNGINITASINSLAVAYTAALSRARRLAPHARLIVVGYPQFAPRQVDTACRESMGLTTTDAAYFDGIVVSLNSTIRTRALASGATFIDTWTPSVGHDACKSPSVRWMEPPSTISGLVGDHPNAKFHLKVASLVVNSIYASSP